MSTYLEHFLDSTQIQLRKRERYHMAEALRNFWFAYCVPYMLMLQFGSIWKMASNELCYECDRISSLQEPTERPIEKVLLNISGEKKLN